MSSFLCDGITRVEYKMYAESYRDVSDSSLIR